MLGPGFYLFSHLYSRFDTVIRVFRIDFHLDKFTDRFSRSGFRLQGKSRIIFAGISSQPYL